MKNILLILILNFPLYTGFAQVNNEQAIAKPKVEKKNIAKELVEYMLINQDFVFNATDMLPSAGGNVNLGYDYDVQVKDGIMTSYLPFIGISYQTPYGAHSSGFDFKLPIKNYEFTKKRKGYRVEVEVKDGADNLKYTFHVTTTGGSTLSVASSKRQSIAYYGTIDPVK